MGAMGALGVDVVADAAASFAGVLGRLPELRGDGEPDERPRDMLVASPLCGDGELPGERFGGMSGRLTRWRCR